MSSKLLWGAVLALALNGCLVTGCVTKSITGMTDPMGNIANTLASKIADEGVLKDWMASANANFNNPKAVAFVRVEVASGIGMEGVDGSIAGEGSGDSTRLPAGLREQLIAQLNGPLSDQQRAAILTMLGWNRTPEGGNPNAPPPPNPGG